MVGLATQIVTLVLTLGGIYLSALALNNPVRKVAILGLAIFGVANFILILVTYENTPEVPHLSDMVLASATAALSAYDDLVAPAENRLLQIIVWVFIGVILGLIGPRAYHRYKNRHWHSSYDIFKLANPELMKGAHVAEDEVQELSEHMREISIQREALGVPFGSAPVSEDSESMTLLREAARDASARNLALHKLREKARRNALNDIYEKLKAGALIAKGFKDPLGLNPTEIEIEASYWKFLKFTGDYKEAEGKGFKFTGIEVARK